MMEGLALGAVTSETDVPHLGFPFHLQTLPPSPVWSSRVLTSSRMQDLRRSRSSLVRDQWPWSLSARERKRLGGGEAGLSRAHPPAGGLQMPPLQTPHF